MDSEDFATALAGALAGDEVAFAALYRMVQPRLLRYLRGLTPDGAEDMAAEAWVEVVLGLGRFDGEAAGFTAWVFTIARRKSIDRSRYQARRPTTVLPEHDRRDPTERDVAESVVEAESTEKALALVRTLPTDQAEAILLRVVAGLEIAQVAELMGRSGGAVRVLTHRGLKRLGATLADRVDRAQV
jgi:RNA polymerase sigma-70 factor (ECF subfamily)